MELEIGSMVEKMFHAPEGAKSIYTNGGTESNELMVRAY